MKKVIIIILSYKSETALKKCLESVYLTKVPKGWGKKVIVVDNNKNNLGFAAGSNVGIRRAIKNGAEAVLLLNQDTIVKDDFLLSLLANPADIAGPVIKFRRKGRWIYDLGGKVNWWMGRTKHIECLKVSGFKSLKIDYVSGCAMLIKRPVLKKIGLLDEKYFLYFEDVDFCLRAKKAGFAIASEPKSIIVHQLTEGSGKPFFQRWHLVRSNLIFINSWITWWRRPIAWSYWLALCLKIFF